MPLCARNTGIYLGFMITTILFNMLGYGRSQRLPTRPLPIMLSLGVVALAIDGCNSFALDIGLPHLYQPHNLLRLATGLLTGLALTLLAIPMVNRMLWQEAHEGKAISSWSQLLPFVLALLLCFCALASQNGYILYPVAILSTAGLIMALGGFNLAVLVLVLRRDETFNSYRAVLLFFGIATLCAAGELLMLAQLKFLLLQTFGVNV